MNLKKYLFQFSVQVLTLFPKIFQSRIHQWARLDQDEMSFVVRPNSVWVGYEIKNETLIRERLPPDVELCPIQIFPFDHDQKKYLFFNFFRVETDYFDGHRLEIVTTVKEKRGNKKRFLILDYYSDAISSDPVSLFKRANVGQKEMHLKTSNDNTKIWGQVKDMYVFLCDASLHNYPLTDQFAIGCNKKIYYGLDKPHLPNILDFETRDVKRVRLIKKIQIWNNLWKECRKRDHAMAFYYPENIPFRIVPASSEKEIQEPDEYDRDEFLGRGMMSLDYLFP